jgi:hypothetical protein
MMKIAQITPAPPGWYVRWRFAAEQTLSYPVTVWAVVDGADTTDRQVVGVDSIGQWPGASGNAPGAEFVCYLYQPVANGQPDDIVNPVQSPAERAR